jgi:hypothetical protein
MSNQELDVNLVIQSFQEKVNQLMTEVVIKDATIRQLTTQLEELQKEDISEKKDK